MSLIFHRSDGEIFEYDGENLYHFGIKGMKWGVRRFQNEDGSLTPAGKRRYGYKNGSFTNELGRLKYEKEKAKDNFKRTEEQYEWPHKKALRARTEYSNASTNYAFEKRKKKFAKIRDKKKSRAEWERLADKFSVYNISANKSSIESKKIRSEIEKIYEKDYYLKDPANRARVKSLRKDMAETQVRLMEELIGKYPGKDRSRIIDKWTNFRDEDYDD